MQFHVTNPVIKKLRTDQSYRLELDLCADQYDEFAALASPACEGKNLVVSIEMEKGNPEASEEKPSNSGRSFFEKCVECWGKKNKIENPREEYKKLLKQKGVIKESTTELSDDELWKIGKGIEFDLYHPEV